MHLTQDAAIKLVESIGSTLGLERVNDASGVSYYAITQDTAVRISDHSTHLQTWVDKGTYTKKNKYSIVIEVNPSKPVLAVQPGIGTFVVTEFKHKLRGLSDDAVLVLANAIKGAIGTGGQFSNPLRVKPKMLASTQLNELKTNKNMKKNVVKINENTLRQIVAESVKKVLKESQNTTWEIAKAILDPKVMLEAIEYYLEKDGLLEEYAHRLNEDYDLRMKYDKEL